MEPSPPQYATLRLPTPVIEAIRQEVETSIHERHARARKEAARHARRIAQIEAHQAKLVQLYLRDLASDEVLREEQERLSAEKKAASRLLGGANAAAEEEVLGTLKQALEKATDPQAATYDPS